VIELCSIVLPQKGKWIGLDGLLLEDPGCCLLDGRRKFRAIREIFDSERMCRSVSESDWGSISESGATHCMDCLACLCEAS